MQQFYVFASLSVDKKYLLYNWTLVSGFLFWQSLTETKLKSFLHFHLIYIMLCLKEFKMVAQTHIEYGYPKSSAIRKW